MEEGAAAPLVDEEDMGSRSNKKPSRALRNEDGDVDIEDACWTPGYLSDPSLAGSSDGWGRRRGCNGRWGRFGGWPRAGWGSTGGSGRRRLCWRRSVSRSSGGGGGTGGR